MTARLAGWGYAAGWAVVKALPESWARWLFAMGAALAYRRQGKGVRRLAANLSRVRPALPDVAAATRAGVHSYARYWCEVFRLPVTSGARIVEQMHCVDDDRLRAAYATGRGVILALPHMANWDLAGAWLVRTGIPFTTVAERLEPASLFDRFVAFRESLGMEVVPLTGGPTAPMEVLAERLRSGGVLCLLADRDLTSNGVAVTLFGATATMPAGPALLAVRTGAILIPVTLWFDHPARWNTRFHPAVVDPGTGDLATRVQAMTQQLADAFAEGIAAHPADWHMLQRLWRDDLDPARRVPDGESVG